MPVYGCLSLLFIVLIVHQTDKDGAKAGFRNNGDVRWNLDRIGNHWYMGRTEYTPLWLQRTEDSHVILQPHAMNGVHYNDCYLEQELSIMRKYIKPTDTCLHYAHRAVRGLLLKLCRKVITVMWDGRMRK